MQCNTEIYTARHTLLCNSLEEYENTQYAIVKVL